MTTAEATSPTPYQLLPRLTDEEYQALKADIAENGIRVPIDVDENGVVLDGHHRSWIAADLRVECPRRVVAGLTDEQKRAHAIAANVYRRSLTREQRREMVGRLRTLGMSTRQIADTARVNDRTVRRDLEPVRPAADAARHTAPITGTDGKTYQPQTLDMRRDLAAQLRDQGMSVAEVGEAMGVAKSTAQTLLTPRKSSASAGTPRNRPADDPQRLARIRELAGKGWASAQIAREIGNTEEYVRQLARDHDIDIPADRVLSGTRRIDSRKVAAEIVATLEGLAVPLRLINYDDLDVAEIREWATSLTESTRPLNRFIKQIKEMAQ